MAPENGNELSAEQLGRLDRRQVDQDQTLLAMQALETALATAAPGREDLWIHEVRQTLGGLGSVTSHEAENADRPDSLLSDIAQNQPRLRNRVRGLRLSYRQLQDAISALETELAVPAARVDFADVRQRLSALLSGLRHQRARESDLIYEAYYEAFHVDLPVERAEDLE